MIFGDASFFLTPEILVNYDIITSRKESLAGNFTLYKNSTQLKLLFQQADCWQQIVKNNLWVYSFPERFKHIGKPLTNRYLNKLLIFFRKASIHPAKIPDINTILCLHSEISVFYGNFILSDEMLKNAKIENWKIIWNDGKLITAHSKQVLYFHFYFLKNLKKYKILCIRNTDETGTIQISQNSVLINVNEHILCK
jgi:hypothetical protein